MLGKLYGRHVHRHSNTKRKEGTIVGIFLGTILYCYAYQWSMGLALAPLRVALVNGILAALVGTLFKGIDNLVVPIALYVLAPRVHVWLSP
jgi:dolichol kinase